jgi:hypothetical protein
MKYKFYEQPEKQEILSLGQEWVKYRESNTPLYFKELQWIAKNTNTKVEDYFVDDWTFGDPVVFHKADGYFGYLLSDFYLYFDTDDWESYTS